MVILDATVTNVALPSIGRGLHGSVTGLQWVVDAYTLSFAAPAAHRRCAGRAARRPARLRPRPGHFRRRFGGLRAGADARRAGGGAVHPGRRRGRARAIVADAAPGRVHRPAGDDPVRSACGAPSPGSARRPAPIVGGVLISVWSWRGVFFLNLPFALAALLAAPRLVPATRAAARVSEPGASAPGLDAGRFGPAGGSRLRYQTPSTGGFPCQPERLSPSSWPLSWWSWSSVRCRRRAAASYSSVSAPNTTAWSARRTATARPTPNSPSVNGGSAASTSVPWTRRPRPSTPGSGPPSRSGSWTSRSRRSPRRGYSSRP